ncbi:MAG: NUDIX domain-containing protein [Candidatus Omnitrophota bacterium]
MLAVLDPVTGVPYDKCERKELHKQKLWHRTVHIIVFTNDGKVIVQKRAPDKEASPDKWDISAAGHVLADQTPLEAALKELEEELAMIVNPKELYLSSHNFRKKSIKPEYEEVIGFYDKIGIYIYPSNMEGNCEYSSVFVGKTNKTVKEINQAIEKQARSSNDACCKEVVCVKAMDLSVLMTDLFEDDKRPFSKRQYASSLKQHAKHLVSVLILEKVVERIQKQEAITENDLLGDVLSFSSEKSALVQRVRKMMNHSKMIGLAA